MFVTKVTHSLRMFRLRKYIDQATLIDLFEQAEGFLLRDEFYGGLIHVEDVGE
jgi:hypothetical protein